MTNPIRINPAKILGYSATALKPSGDVKPAGVVKPDGVVKPAGLDKVGSTKT